MKKTAIILLIFLIFSIQKSVSSLSIFIPENQDIGFTAWVSKDNTNPNSPGINILTYETDKIGIQKAALYVTNEGSSDMMVKIEFHQAVTDEKLNLNYGKDNSEINNYLDAFNPPNKYKINEHVTLKNMISMSANLKQIKKGSYELTISKYEIAIIPIEIDVTKEALKQTQIGGITLSAISQTDKGYEGINSEYKTNIPIVITPKTLKGKEIGNTVNASLVKTNNKHLKLDVRSNSKTLLNTNFEMDVKEKNGKNIAHYEKKGAIFVPDASIPFDLSLDHPLEENKTYELTLKQSNPGSVLTQEFHLTNTNEILPGAKEETNQFGWAIALVGGLILISSGLYFLFLKSRTK
ncbi:MAG: DUF916 domain-containing protein [Streptococcaceae bacterium]|jgi:hypothetical protein|nr:DUF916 domain-containing protein [Streptococcaceae bacterium]